MFMNKLCLRPLLLLALAFLTIPAGPGSANAHRINIFALAETGQVRAECRFSRSAPAQDCPVTVFDADSGKVLLEGRTDKSGLFIFPIKNDYLHFPHGLRIRINAGEGHENECLVDHSELAAAASASAATQTSLTRDARTPLSADRTSPAASREQTASTATASALSMSRQELEDLVTRAVDKRITPLRVMLSAQVEKGPGLTEILGGIGWILGLFGVWALCTARRK